MMQTTLTLDQLAKVAAINKHRVANLWDDLVLVDNASIPLSTEFEYKFKLEALDLLLKDMLSLNPNSWTQADIDFVIVDIKNVNTGLQLRDNDQASLFDPSIYGTGGYIDRYPVQKNDNGEYELIDPSAASILYYDTAALLEKFIAKMPQTILSDDEIKTIGEINAYRIVELWNQAIVEYPNFSSSDSDTLLRKAALDKVLIEMFNAAGASS